MRLDLVRAPVHPHMASELRMINMFEFPSVHNKSLRVCVFFGVQVSYISFLPHFSFSLSGLVLFVPTLGGAIF